MESCKEQGLPAPEIKVVAPFVNLTIWFKQSLANEIIDLKPPVNNIETPSDTPSRNEIPPKSRLISPQDKVFEFCRIARGISEIAEMLGVNDKKWVRKKYVAPFIGTRLQMTIPDKPNSQNQKYKIIE